MKNRLVIGFDVIVILIPFLIGVIPDIVDAVSYLLVCLSLITIFGLWIYEEGGNELTRVELEHRKKPHWWNTYDLASDAIFIVVWASHGFYAVGLALLVVKFLTIKKIPNYYKR